MMFLERSFPNTRHWFAICQATTCKLHKGLGVGLEWHHRALSSKSRLLQLIAVQSHHTLRWKIKEIHCFHVVCPRNNWLYACHGHHVQQSRPHVCTYNWLEPIGPLRFRSDYLCDTDKKKKASVVFKNHAFIASITQASKWYLTILHAKSPFLLRWFMCAKFSCIFLHRN